MRTHARRLARRVWPDPKLGDLNQHPPVDIQIPDRYKDSTPPKEWPSISIVTPTRNHADFLERTIRSVVEQDYPRLEYIVQDGDSDDDTAEVVMRYAERLHHWESRPDEGQAHAVNLGMANATGEILAYLNSDDLLLPGSLTYVARYFEKHPNVDVVYGHRILIDEHDREIGRWVLPRHSDEALSWADFVPQETLFWRRGIWEAAGGEMDQSFRYALDWDLLLRFREAGAHVVRLPRFLGAFRIHGSQKTTAEAAAAGADEMERLRVRVHQREVTYGEIARALRGYMRRHILLHQLYRGHLLRY